MNILVVTQYFWPESFRINDLALSLRKKGHEVTVLTGIPNYPSGSFFPGYGFLKPRYQDYHGIKIIRVPLIPRGKGQGWRLAINYLSFTLSASFLAPFYCRKKYDLIFVCQYSPVTVGIPAIVLKKLKDIPIMFWIQDLWPESLSATGVVRSLWVLRMVGKLVNFIYQNCNLILVQSRGFFPYVKKEGVKSDRIIYFPNWAEEMYKPVALEKNAPEQSGMPAGFRIMFAGNIGAAQDFGTILTAAEKLKSYTDIHWLIAGDGRKRSWVEEQVKSRGLVDNVHLLGRHPVESMPRFFALADVLLVTLKSDPIFSLTIPSKLQSYLACGRPVIAALNGEGARIVGEAGAGFTCPAENPDRLAHTVIRMYQAPEQARQEMGLRGRAYYEVHFKRDMLLDRLEAWMEKIVNEGYYGN
ncbi:glycosyltransferase family 4 protein [Desulfoscipio geothermicus]|uniref:Glycosyltransferase involved in cell wall bisynthesis n=1 Tax=Desulfoscipio geothermicus DSM 3669 TaxID=1121426 RepID=A0A1I6D011_9FIRM|nr:glycosyltransferase family 4 protein [Desulfoscipio geothermicus]SFQ98692.1 Glycosyltransferase involved in cell wall bisynthesis [Desulfoscipio geothermicus DSM 3669]